LEHEHTGAVLRSVAAVERPTSSGRAAAGAAAVGHRDTIWGLIPIKHEHYLGRATPLDFVYYQRVGYPPVAA